MLEMKMRTYEDNEFVPIKKKSSIVSNCNSDSDFWLPDMSSLLIIISFFSVKLCEINMYFNNSYQLFFCTGVIFIRVKRETGTWRKWKGWRTFTCWTVKLLILRNRKRRLDRKKTKTHVSEFKIEH